jgi:hypothetical protein
MNIELGVKQQNPTAKLSPIAEALQVKQKKALEDSTE